MIFGLIAAIALLLLVAAIADARHHGLEAWEERDR